MQNVMAFIMNYFWQFQKKPMHTSPKELTENNNKSAYYKEV